MKDTPRARGSNRDGRPLAGVAVREVTQRPRSPAVLAKLAIERAIREENFRADARVAGAGKRYRGRVAEAQPRRAAEAKPQTNVGRIRSRHQERLAKHLNGE